MRIWYQGVEITNQAQVRECRVKDTCGERCDSLDILFENASGWFMWQPEEDDMIIVELDGYNSGVMYLNAVMPEDGKYRIIASALPSKARAKTYRSFYGQTIGQIMDVCAAYTNMSRSVYGIEESTVIPYIQQEGETSAAFLYRLLMFEGAALKCINGKYAAIGIEYAAGLDAGAGFYLVADQRDVTYTRMGMAYKSITIRTPYGEATAEDTAVDSSHVGLVLGCLPVTNVVQAGRWARGKLQCLNRKMETLQMKTGFNPGISAMVRVDIAGNTDAAGIWLVEEAEHDLINRKTSFIMHRYIDTIR